MSTVSAEVTNSICTNCNTPCKQDDLYCSVCGHIIAARIEVDQTRQLSDATNRVVDLQWGTSYFHPRARLYLHEENTPKPILVPLDNSKIILGRKTESAILPQVDLTPYNATALGVSRSHTQIERRGTTLYVSDLKSANGTFVNQIELDPNAPVVLRNRAVLQLGKMILRVQFI